jgi:hypothetical protein
MRMEELQDNQFIKKTDTVEKYLLDLVKNYFESNSEVNPNTQEYIIQKAVQRMKEELDIDNAGVVSINGQTGDVTIDCASLGAEPFIGDKKTAFNCDFGTTKGTVCAGDDPRLNDKRVPVTHSHSMDEINGLQGQISSLQNLIKTLDGTGHNHNNKNVLDKISYSGKNAIINLDILDTVSKQVDDKIAEVDALIATYKTALDTLVTQTENKINSL